jgi:hemolysin activation/secretion protein
MATSAWWSGATFGQDFERYRPLPIEPPSTVPSIPGVPIGPAVGSDEELVGRLDAVIVVDRPDQVDATNAFAGEEGLSARVFAADSLVHSPAFSAIVSRYLGGPITLRRLNAMAREIILLYRRTGQPVVDVIIPEQNITGGTVQIVVVESRVGRVIIRGGCWSNLERLQEKVRCTQSGQRLYEPYLRHDLLRLNDYPFRRVEVDLEPGAYDGTTDVIFEVNDVFPARAYMGYEDTGVPNLLLERVFVGATVGDVLGLDSLLSYQGTTDTEFHHLNAHSVFYQIPTDEFWSFEAYGSWVGVDPIVAAGFDHSGESWQSGFALRRQLTYNVRERSSLSFGFDFKSTNTNVEFGGIQVFDSAAELVTLRLGYQLQRRYAEDEYLQVRNDLVVGPGPQFSPGNTTEAFSTVRPNTSPSFVYDRLVVERAWNLPRYWQFVGRGTGQVTSNRLLYSEMLGYGGFDSIRGYHQRTLNGDMGWLLNLELGPRPYHFGTARRPQQLRGYVFVDMGDAYTMHPQPGEEQQKFLASTGVGMRYTMTNRISLRLDYGCNLTETPNQPLSRQEIHLGVVTLFGPQP